MKYYNLHKSEIKKYLDYRKETIHIDGNADFDDVRVNILATLQQQNKIHCLKRYKTKGKTSCEK